MADIFAKSKGLLAWLLGGVRGAEVRPGIIKRSRMAKAARMFSHRNLRYPLMRMRCGMR